MHQPKTPSIAARGFTLVEIMVGLVLGLLAMIIMYQVFATFEGQRRTTVGGGDAQSAGHLSMYMMEREVRLAGLGLIVMPRVSDPVKGDYYDGQLACPGGIVSYSAKAGGVSKAMLDKPTAPLAITDGGAGPDSFTVRFSHSAEAAAPPPLAVKLLPGDLASGIKVNAAPFSTSPPQNDKNSVFKKDDFILVGQPGAPDRKHCIRVKLTSVEWVGDTASPQTVLKAASTEDENPADGAGFVPGTGYDADLSFVMRLGTAAEREYKVNANQQLTVGLKNDPAPVAIAEGVVSLQIMYGLGLKPAASGTPPNPCDAENMLVLCHAVRVWTDAKAFDGIDWHKLDEAPDPAKLEERLTAIKRIKAVRIAVVTRSQNLERDVLYGAGLEIQPKASCTSGGDIVDVAGNMRVCAWADGLNPDGTAHTAPRVDLTGMADWDRYRYKVFETIVPLRNMIWGTKGS